MSRYKARHVEDRTTSVVTMFVLLPLGLIALGALMLMLAFGW